MGWGKGGSTMKFFVICRAIEPPPVGYPDQVELLEATQQRLGGGDPRIVETFTFAGERAFAMVIDVPTARELEGAVFGLPAEPLCRFEVHVLAEDLHPHGL
jgi:hypothetical protein